MSHLGITLFPLKSGTFNRQHSVGDIHHISLDAGVAYSCVERERDASKAYVQRTMARQFAAMFNLSKSTISNN